MKRLYLVRHAKSSWTEEGLSDMDRPLKGRGIRDAHNSSQWLAQQGHFPQRMLASPATRAMHTALIFAKNLGLAYSDIQIEARIYGANRKELLALIRGLDDRIESYFLFGHNPTLTDFVNFSIAHRIDKVPTTGVACLQYNCAQWQEVDCEAELVLFDYPKRRQS